jgi:hemerythrin
MSIDHLIIQDYNYHRARHAELLRRSETVYLVCQARQKRKRRKGISHYVLGWIGQHLVSWGGQLQERYSNNTEAPHLDSSYLSW